jgi:ferredoxin
VELRILKRLFTPEEAELTLHLTLIAEEPRVIARRAKITFEEAAQRLDEIEKKGLIFGIHSKTKPTMYMAQPYMVGIWEAQVNNLNIDIVKDMEEYWPTFFDVDIYAKAPQLRTIPVGESVPSQAAVLPYEVAENIIRGQKRITVAPCICREEHQLLGDGCEKPQDVCMAFGVAAEYRNYNDRGRAIDVNEALSILTIAEETGLVLQPDNSQDPNFLCCCCGDCCAVLSNIKRHPNPASYVASPFMAVTDPEICSGCGNCVERCQMEAMSLDGGVSVLDETRCIGCGLCVTTCSTDSLTLMRKPDAQQPLVPKNTREKYIRMGQSRGKMKTSDLIRMQVNSKKDRFMASLD